MNKNTIRLIDYIDILPKVPPKNNVLEKYAKMFTEIVRDRKLEVVTFKELKRKNYESP